MRPYLRVANVFEDRIDTSDVKEMNFTPAEYETYHLRFGDILLNEGQSPELLGRPALYRDEVPGACFQNTLIRFRARQSVDRRFALAVFRYYMHSSRFAREARITTNIAHLSAGRFCEVEFPVPPLPEQRRIVEKIDELFSKLDAGVAALERVRANLKRYRAAVLKAAVEGKLTEQWRAEHPDTESASVLLERILQERRQKWEEDQLAKFAEKGTKPPKNWQAKYKEPQPPDTTDLPELPEGWVWATLDELLSHLRNGLPPKPSDTPPGHRILRISAVRPMLVDMSDVRYLDRPDNDVVTYFVHSGDLLFTRYNGSLHLVGVAAMVREPAVRTLHPDKLIRCRLVLGEPMPAFVEAAANVGVSRQHILARARTTAGQTGVSGADIREMPVPLPPFAEQAEIVAEVERRLSVLDEIERETEAALKRAARLRQSILKRAFEGRLVPQDPNDEPASVLLERIKAQRAVAPSARRSRKGYNGEEQRSTSGAAEDRHSKGERAP